MAVVLVLWLLCSAYLLGRGLIYLAALIAGPAWGWVLDKRMALLFVPFLLPLAILFYGNDPAAHVIVGLAFVLTLGWAALYVFKSLLHEVVLDRTRVDRWSHVGGAALAVAGIVVALVALQ